MECKEPVNCWKCGDDKSIDQKQNIYYHMEQQEDGRATVKKMKEEQERK